MATLSKGEFREEQHPRDHGKFSHTEGAHGASMAERTRPGGDLHERAKASLNDHAFVMRHAARLEQAADEAKSNFPGRENTDDAHHAAMAYAHIEAMRIHHEQDTIGDNPHAQRTADIARESAGYRREDLETAHASVMHALDRQHSTDAFMYQYDKEAQARGFADASAERAHHQALRDADSRSRGFADEEAETAHRQAEQAKATRADEDAAIAAGHVSGAAKEIGDRYEASINEHRRAAEAHADALDRAHHEAADALAQLHEYSHEDHEELSLEHATPRLTEDFRETQTALNEAIGRNEHEGYKRELSRHEPPVHPDETDLVEGYRYQPYDDEHDNARFAHHASLEYVPHPDDSEHDLTDEEHAHQLAEHKTWRQHAEAAYNEALDSHKAEFHRRATAAQDALERLHEHQSAAHEGLKASSKAADKERNEARKQLDKIDTDELVHEHAFAHHERDEDGNFADDKVHADYERAGAAAESTFEHAQTRIDDHGFDASEALGPLRDGMRSTRDAIKELAKITGRAGRLPEKPKGKAKKSWDGTGRDQSDEGGLAERKSTNRPDSASGASVERMPPKPHRLKLQKLDFLSLVDTPAQETANIRLIKRGVSPRSLTARIVKIDESNPVDPLIWCWAFTTAKADGTPYHDLQGDAITPDFVRAAEAFMREGGAVDEMHDSTAKSHVAFAFPWDSEIATAMLGPEAAAANKTAGLMVAIRPTADQLAKAKSGEFGGVSIAGNGIREALKSFGKSDSKCASCGAYGKSDSDGDCAKCGKAMKRHRPMRKQAVLTSAADGHQHQIDLDDPSEGWSDQLATSYNTSEGATSGHCHAWIYDATTGKITIAEDSGHNHTVDAVVPADVIRQAALNESGERCSGCGEMQDEDCKFCPNCGKAMSRDGVPTAVSDEKSGSTPAVVIISARAPEPISTPSAVTPTVKSDKEPTAMADTDNRIKTLEAENAQLKKMATLSDAQRAHISKLDEQDATNFLNMNTSQRDAVLAEIAKADEIVYESPYTKRVYRKSSPLEIIEAAREADASKSAREQLDIAKRELEFSKRGESVLKNWPIGAKREFRARLMKAVDGEFKDPAEHDEAVKALKSADFALEQLTVAKGVNPHSDPSDAPATPQAQLDRMTAEYAQKNNVPIHKAAAAVLETRDGAALYAKLPVGHA